AADEMLAGLVAAALCDGWRGTPVVSAPRLAVPEGPYLERCSPGGLATFRAACDRLVAAGFEVRAVPAFADFAEIDARHRLLVAADAWQVHERWFSLYGDRYHAETRALLERGRAADPETVRRAGE